MKLLIDFGGPFYQIVDKPDRSVPGEYVHTIELPDDVAGRCIKVQNDWIECQIILEDAGIYNKVEEPIDE